MRKIFKTLGLATVGAAIFAVAVAGTAFAAGLVDKGTQNQGEECLCVNGTGDCIPKDYSYNYRPLKTSIWQYLGTENQAYVYTKT